MNDNPATIRTIHFYNYSAVDFNVFGNVYYFVLRDKLDNETVTILMDEVDELIRFLQECKEEVNE